MERSKPKCLTDLASTPITVAQSVPVSEAAQLMQQHHVGSLVVTGPREEPVGLVTDRDLALATLTRPRGAAAPVVNELVSTPLLTLPASSTIPDATRFLGEHRIRRVGLTGASGELVAVLSSDTLLMYVGTQIRRITEAISREFQEERNPTGQSSSRFGSE